ncbi:MAG: ATP-binding protein [Coriobacteriia bacterium]|nr:ATP-binding protein [Coriobacteriia bacterium]
MIGRPDILDSIQTALLRAPVVVLSGPRQCGKTTLARQLLSRDSVNYFDLEDPTSLARLDEPMTALGPLEGLVVIDEVQRRPDLFPILRVLVDREQSSARFLILGSASGELERQSSESLAGRIERIEIGGFSLREVGADEMDRLWYRGGFPRSFLAADDEDSSVWRDQFIQTLLERDMPQWGVTVPATALRRLWTIVAHYHGQTWNAAEAARTLDVSQPTIRRYLDLLTDAQVVRQLQPHYANLKTRQVKSPKVYVRDSGLLHRLLGINTERALVEHPKVGASWEGFALEQVLASERYDDATFWATHQGAEIDVLLHRNGARFGVECKRTDAPKLTPSIRIALQDLALERVAILYPGTRRYPLAKNVEAVPLRELAVHPGHLFGAD